MIGRLRYGIFRFWLVVFVWFCSFEGGFMRVLAFIFVKRGVFVSFILLGVVRTVEGTKVKIFR